MTRKTQRFVSALSGEVGCEHWQKLMWRPDGVGVLGCASVCIEGIAMGNLGKEHFLGYLKICYIFMFVLIAAGRL